MKPDHEKTRIGLHECTQAMSQKELNEFWSMFPAIFVLGGLAVLFLAVKSSLYVVALCVFSSVYCLVKSIKLLGRVRERVYKELQIRSLAYQKAASEEPVESEEETGAGDVPEGGMNTDSLAVGAIPAEGNSGDGIRTEVQAIDLDAPLSESKFGRFVRKEHRGNYGQAVWDLLSEHYNDELFEACFSDLKRQEILRIRESVTKILDEGYPGGENALSVELDLYRRKSMRPEAVRRMKKNPYTRAAITCLAILLLVFIVFVVSDQHGQSGFASFCMILGFFVLLYSLLPFYLWYSCDKYINREKNPQYEKQMENYLKNPDVYERIREMSLSARSTRQGD